jgi:hypothetical protein
MKGRTKANTLWTADEIEDYLASLPGEMGPRFWEVRIVMGRFGYGSEAMRDRVLADMRTEEGLTYWAERANP